MTVGMFFRDTSWKEASVWCELREKRDRFTKTYSKISFCDSLHPPPLQPRVQAIACFYRLSLWCIYLHALVPTSSAFTVNSFVLWWAWRNVFLLRRAGTKFAVNYSYLSLIGFLFPLLSAIFLPTGQLGRVSFLNSCLFARGLHML